MNTMQWSEQLVRAVTPCTQHRGHHSSVTVVLVASVRALVPISTLVLVLFELVLVVFRKALFSAKSTKKPQLKRGGALVVPAANSTSTTRLVLVLAVLLM